MIKRFVTIICLLLAVASSVDAQERRTKTVALSTDIVDWANLGTVNLEAGVGFSRHMSVTAGAKYNPWSFKTQKVGLQLYNKQTTAYAGLRYWPWYVFSGWWIGAQTQYTQYAETGIWRHALDTGSAVGGRSVVRLYTYAS